MTDLAQGWVKVPLSDFYNKIHGEKQFETTPLSKLFRFPLHNDLILGGGCIRDTLIKKKPKDYDLFVLSKDNFDKNVNGSDANIASICNTITAVTRLPRTNSKYGCEVGSIVVTSNNYKNLIQFVYRDKDFGTLIKNFDFTINLFFVKGKDLVYHKSAMSDLLGRRLVPVGKNVDAKLMNRAMKFTQEGYSLSTEFLSLLKLSVVEQAASINTFEV